ncbi:MAG TPA: YwqG family protein [Blastocatellia bacterium]|nr:YwqG family protein [Blastocatellia bacterium]
MTSERFWELVELLGLGHRADELRTHSSEALSVRASSAQGNELDLCESKIGGLPDLPDEQIWPAIDRRPLSFIAQINLSQLPKFAERGLLPSYGILSFFYDAVNQPWGLIAQDRGKWKVLYFDTSSGISRRPAEVDANRCPQFEAYAMEFEPKITFSRPGLSAIKEVFVDVDELDMTYDQSYGLIEEFETVSEASLGHQLLGRPYALQEDMEPLCESLLGDGTVNEKRGELPSISDWRLLLQISSDRKVGMEWGDAGYLYYWIKRDDLIRQAFDKVRVFLQCG